MSNPTPTSSLLLHTGYMAPAIYMMLIGALTKNVFAIAAGAGTILSYRYCINSLSRESDIITNSASELTTAPREEVPSHQRAIAEVD